MPGGTPIQSGLGVVTKVTGTNPAAGVEISETVPAGKFWRFLAMEATLVADATVANRVVALKITDGSTELMRFNANVAHTASQTRLYSFNGNYNVVAVGQGAAGLIVGVGELPVLQPGWVIATATDSFQAGDNWGAPTILVEEFTRMVDRD